MTGPPAPIASVPMPPFVGPACPESKGSTPAVQILETLVRRRIYPSTYLRPFWRHFCHRLVMQGTPATARSERIPDGEVRVT